MPIACAKVCSLQPVPASDVKGNEVSNRDALHLFVPRDLSHFVLEGEGSQNSPPQNMLLAYFELKAIGNQQT